MKRVLALGLLALVCVGAWQISSKLSSDSVAMAIGVFFGMIAGLPVAILVLAANRRRTDAGFDPPMGRRGRNAGGSDQAYLPGPGYGHGYGQPPVIVLAGNGFPGQGMSGGNGQPYAGRHALPLGTDPVDVRQFKVVGENEEWVDEW